MYMISYVIYSPDQTKKLQPDKIKHVQSHIFVISLCIMSLVKTFILIVTLTLQ